MRPIPTAAPEFLRDHEALVLRVYDDAQPRVILKPGVQPVGTLTAGYGHSGPELRIGLPVTQDMAESWLRLDLDTAARRLERKIGADVVAELTDHQYAALCSFVFNLGVDGPMANATIWKRLKARQFDQCPLEIMKFDKARVGPIDPATGKRTLKKLSGLVKRRSAEVVLWSTDEPGSEDVHLTSAALRDIETPATSTDPVPAKKSATVWGAVTAAVGGGVAYIGNLLSQIPEFAQTALNAINPFAEKSEWAQLVANGIGGVAAVAGIYVAWSVLKKKREARG